MFSSRFCVILIMTSLAQSFEVFIRAIFYDLVHVRDCQHNICFLACLGVETVCMVLNTTKLAPVVGSLQYLRPYILPVLRVSSLVFGFNRHVCQTSTNSPSAILYQVSSLIRSPSTYSVFTHTGIEIPFSSKYFHSASVIHEPFFALAIEP